MAQILAHKVVSSLPDPPVANSIYFVRVGAGFDLYVTNSTGLVTAYALNVPTARADAYTFATIPDATSVPVGTMVCATDDTFGPRVVFSDGTRWLRMDGVEAYSDSLAKDGEFLTMNGERLALDV